MPSLALLVELTASNSSAEMLVPVASTAGPPVAFRLAVPAAGTVTVPALASRNAGTAPEAVVSARSPNVVVLVPGVDDAHATVARVGDGDGVERARAQGGAAGVKARGRSWR
jgi:hypothetical protein